VTLRSTDQAHLTFVAKACFLVEAHRHIRCTVPAGVGVAHGVFMVIVGLQSGVAPFSLSYAQPEIHDITPLEFGTSGDTAIIVQGRHFGPASHTFGVAVAYMNRDGLSFNLNSCVVSSDARIRCFTSPGLGSLPRWEVTIANQTGALINATNRYRLPMIQNLSPRCGPDEVEVRVKVIGNNFGAPDFGTLDVMFGNESSSLVAQNWSHTVADCSIMLPSPGRRNLTVVASDQV
jgi:hypothetical protein